MITVIMTTKLFIRVIIRVAQPFVWSRLSGVARGQSKIRRRRLAGATWPANVDAFKHNVATSSHQSNARINAGNQQAAIVGFHFDKSVA